MEKQFKNLILHMKKSIPLNCCHHIKIINTCTSICSNCLISTVFFINILPNLFHLYFKLFNYSNIYSTILHLHCNLYKFILDINSKYQWTLTYIIARCSNAA